MPSLQQPHAVVPPTLMILETRGAGQRRILARPYPAPARATSGRPQPKWLSEGASAPSSHRETEGGGGGGGEPWLSLAEPTAQLRFHFPLKENALDGR